MCRLTYTDATQAELTVDRMWTTTPVTAGVTPHLELWGFLLLLDQSFLRHVLKPP